jgi:hypothetical protein
MNVLTTTRCFNKIIRGCEDSMEKVTRKLIVLNKTYRIE